MTAANICGSLFSIFFDDYVEITNTFVSTGLCEIRFHIKLCKPGGIGEQCINVFQCRGVGIEIADNNYLRPVQHFIVL